MIILTFCNDINLFPLHLKIDLNVLIDSSPSTNYDNQVLLRLSTDLGAAEALREGAKRQTNMSTMQFQLVSL